VGFENTPSRRNRWAELEVKGTDHMVPVQVHHVAQAQMDGAVAQMVRDFCLDSRARGLRDATRITVAVSDLVA
jgi:hypothetical protein